MQMDGFTTTMLLNLDVSLAWFFPFGFDIMGVLLWRKESRVSSPPPSM